MGLDWASTHQTTLLNGPGPPFPHLSSLGKLNQAGKKKGQAPQPGSPLWHPAQVFGEAPSPCQACVPDWVPIFGYPSGFLLVSCCHGYWSQLLWQKKTPPGQHSASPHQPPPQPISSAQSATAGSKEKAKVPGRVRCPREVEEGSQFSKSHSPTMKRASASSLLLGLVPGTEGCHLHPQLCFHFTDGAEAALAPRSRTGKSRPRTLA